MIAGMMSADFPESRSKQKIVLVPSPSGKLGFCAWDYETFKPLEEHGWMPTLAEAVKKLQDSFEIAGLLSNECIIPLAGLIPGHESLKTEYALDRLCDAIIEQDREASSAC